MKFKVYNGPEPLPKCRRFFSFDHEYRKDMICLNDIDPHLSDRLCTNHAKEYVWLFDTQPNFNAVLARLFE